MHAALSASVRRLAPQRLKRLIRNRHKATFARHKLSYHDLRKFGRVFETPEKALIVYIEFPYEDLLPNADVLPHYLNDCERYYRLLAAIPSESYASIIATGLLEHLKTPERLIEESHRILKGGGKLYISASSVFCIHRGPDDYFHVTHFGMRELLKTRPWAHVDIRGSCGPFKCVGMMLQRILLQCETYFVIRPFVELLAHVLPALDRLVIRQYSDRSYSAAKRIDSMMPSNIQLIATK